MTIAIAAIIFDGTQRERARAHGKWRKPFLVN